MGGFFIHLTKTRIDFLAPVQAYKYLREKERQDRIGAIDNKKYVLLQEIVDEIGRMLGGWIKSTKER